jgi:Phosphate-starvation-inducible E family
MPDEKLRKQSGDYLATIEVGILTILAVLISLTALVAIARSGKLLWDTLHQWMVVTDSLVILRVLDQLLIVLMLVEILHTVRISIRSHTLVTEPFLVVGLIASIRRILVITLEAATLTKEGKWSGDGASVFHASMIELGLLGLLILALVFSITLLRRTSANPEEDTEGSASTPKPPRDRNVDVPSARQA